MAGLFDKIFVNNGEIVKKSQKMYGKVNGFYVVSEYNAAIARVITKISYNETSDLRSAITSQFQTLKNEDKTVQTLEFVDHKVVIGQQYKSKKTIAMTEKIIMSITNVLAGFQCMSGCEICGATDSVHPIEIEGSVWNICPECANRIQVEFEKNRANMRAQSSNIALGLVGALIGALIGGALWFGIYQLGYIIAWMGFVVVILAAKGYEILGKALDVKGIIVSVIISGLAVYGAVHLAWSYEFFKVLKNYDYTFGDCFKSLWELVELAESKADLIGELVKCFLFFLVGAVIYTVSAINKARGNYSMKRV